MPRHAELVSFSATSTWALALLLKMKNLGKLLLNQYLPLITIVTVALNAGSELKMTIDSVCKQNYPNLEYVVIDGGSTDDTLQVIDANIHVIDRWLSEPDRGIYDAMNKGVQNSRGEFIIFMNAGDEFYSCESLSETIANNSTYDVIYGDHWVCGSARSDGHNKAKHFEHIYMDMFCCHQSVVFRKDCLIEEPFSLRYGTAGDFENLCRLYKKKVSFKKVPVIISKYRAGGVSDLKRVQSVNNRILALQETGLLTLKGCVYNLYCFLCAAAIGLLRRL